MGCFRKIALAEKYRDSVARSVPRIGGGNFANGTSVFRHGFQDSLNYRDENSPLRGVIESKHPRDSMEINQQVNEHEPLVR